MLGLRHSSRYVDNNVPGVMHQTVQPPQEESDIL